MSLSCSSCVSVKRVHGLAPFGEHHFPDLLDQGRPLVRDRELPHSTVHWVLVPLNETALDKALHYTRSHVGSDTKRVGDMGHRYLPPAEDHGEGSKLLEGQVVVE